MSCIHATIHPPSTPILDLEVSSPLRGNSLGAVVHYRALAKPKFESPWLIASKITFQMFDTVIKRIKPSLTFANFLSSSKNARIRLIATFMWCFTDQAVSTSQEAPKPDACSCFLVMNSPMLRCDFSERIHSRSLFGLCCPWRCCSIESARTSF